jgi:uncharacterized damage-inducible protein DinB
MLSGLDVHPNGGPVHDRLAPIYEIFKLNSRLFLNCLDGWTEDQVRWRPSPDTNSAAFIALHLVDSRHYIAKVMGMKMDNPFAPILESARTIDDVKSWPPLEEARTAWKAVTGNLRERFKAITPEELAAKAEWQDMPMDDRTQFGLLVFMMQHESYHIGQLAILRKQAGLPAMSYR